MPDIFYSISKEEIKIKSPIPFVNFKINPKSNVALANSSNKYDCNLSLFNIPLKDVTLEIVKRQRATPCGIPFGVKIFTNGVMIINTAPVETKDGDIDTSEISSVKKGDVITEVNGVEINKNEDFLKIVQNSNGNSLDVKILRGNLRFETKITPVKPVNEDKFRVGFWVRDSSSGIGMITFLIDDEKINNRRFFAGLGHGIRDIDTDKLIPLSHGEIMKAVINGVIKPCGNDTGELRGSFVGDEPIGIIKSNDESGIYGILNHNIESDFDPLEIALKQEIKTGPAKIISTVFGSTPQMYDINIDNVSLDKLNPNKNLSFSVCDKRLLERTGGVVQGMSGSPIIQNNMIIGAITHVVSTNPLRGYGIFSETMINNLNFN